MALTHLPQVILPHWVPELLREEQEIINQLSPRLGELATTALGKNIRQDTLGNTRLMAMTDFYRELLTPENIQYKAIGVAFLAHTQNSDLQPLAQFSEIALFEVRGIPTNVATYIDESSLSAELKQTARRAFSPEDWSITTNCAKPIDRRQGFRALDPLQNDFNRERQDAIALLLNAGQEGLTLVRMLSKDDNRRVADIASKRLLAWEMIHSPALPSITA